MIKVSKEEAKMIREKLPSVHIAIVNRHHPYKKYYAEETKRSIALLEKMRGEKIYIY